MKQLIEQAMTDYYNHLISIIPQTKKETKDLVVDSINPYELTNFLIENNVPKDCWFESDDDGDVIVYYVIQVPTTEKDKLNHMINRFNNEIFKKIYNIYIENGYVRIEFNSASLKNFKKTVYEMFIERDFESLVNYYSLYFKKD